MFSAVVLSFWHWRHAAWHPADRVFSVLNPIDFSWRNRIEAWEGDLQILGERPWFGAGWGLPETLYENYYLAPKLTEGAAIETNDYLMLGATLGIPTLCCFGMCFWLLTTSKNKAWRPLRARLPHQEKGTMPADALGQHRILTNAESMIPPARGKSRNDSTWNCPIAGFFIQHSIKGDCLQTTCRAGAIVLLVGFWFDDGLFTLATAFTFWVLIESGRQDSQTSGSNAASEGDNIRTILSC